jgi:hypothetical protein
MGQRNKENERLYRSQEKNLIMEHVSQIKQSIESNLAGEDLQSVMSALQSENCHCVLACQDT